MRRSRWRLVGAMLLLAAQACQWTPDTSSGRDSVIQVQGGQAYRGSISEQPASASQPTASFTAETTTIYIGGSKAVKGEVGHSANAVALGVAGDNVYWRVPAIDPVTRDDPETAFSYSATLSISNTLLESPLLQANSDGTWTLPLSVRAVDNTGRFGDPKITPMILDPIPIVGTLAVSLQWDSAADLDLHVLVPSISDAGEPGYTEVWSKARSAAPKDVPPDGVLDFDSNANCQTDGRNRENVVWTGTPPTGHYVVRVAAASLCGLTSASFWAYASVPNQTKGQATGVLTEAATRSGADEGSGITAFDFYYP